MGSVISYCCGGVDPPFDVKVRSVIDPLILSDDPELNDRMKRILRKRFVSQIVLYEFKSDRVGRRYNVLRFIVTVGSMVLPTLQTIQSDPKVSAVDNEIFWAAIGTSLTVMIANGMIQMFGFDKKYVIYHLAVEKMKSIGWQWLERSGKYALNPDGTMADYADNWAMFWNDLEKVKSLTVGSVYGGDDSSGPPPELPKMKKKNTEDNDKPKTYAESATERALSEKHDSVQLVSRKREEAVNLVQPGLQDVSSIIGNQIGETLSNAQRGLQDAPSIVESRIGDIKESTADVQFKHGRLSGPAEEVVELTSVQEHLLEDAQNIAETEMDTLNNVRDGVLQNINNRD